MLAVANFVPVVLKLRSSTSSVWPTSVLIHFPEPMSHNLTVLKLGFQLLVDRASSAELPCKLKLTARNLALVPFELVDHLSVSGVPNLSWEQALRLLSGRKSQWGSYHPQSWNAETRAIPRALSESNGSFLFRCPRALLCSPSSQLQWNIHVDQTKQLQFSPHALHRY